MCIAKKKSSEGSGEQQDAGQGGNKNSPLTLTAVTRTAASRSREPNPVSGLVPRFRPALVQQVASVLSSAVAVYFFYLQLGSLLYLNVSLYVEALFTSQRSLTV